MIFGPIWFPEIFSCIFLFRYDAFQPRTQVWLSIQYSIRQNILSWLELEFVGLLFVWGSSLLDRYLLIGSIHEFVISIMAISYCSYALLFITSTKTSLFKGMNEMDANLDRAYRGLLHLEIYSISTVLNRLFILCTLFAYFFISSFLASYVPKSWFTINCESL